MGAEFQINTGTPGLQTNPSVAIFRNGGFVVTWLSTHVYAQRFNSDGKKNGDEFLVYSRLNNNFPLSNPLVATFNDNSFIVSGIQDYLGFTSSITNYVFFKKYNAMGTEETSGTGTEYQGYESIYSHNMVTFPSGGFLLAWVHGDDHTYTAQRYNSMREKEGDSFEINTYTTNTQYLTALASFTNEWFIAIWQRQDKNYYGLFGQKFDGLNNKVESEFQINTHILEVQGFPAVASFLDNNFVVAWESVLQAGSSTNIFARNFYFNSTAINDEYQVNTHDLGYQGHSSIAVGKIGKNYTITWQSSMQDGSGEGIFGQMYIAEGQRNGAEFQINAHTNENQRYPCAAVFDDGNVITVWQSENQDGSSYGIFARIFNETKSSKMLEFNITEAGHYYGTEYDDHFILHNGNNDVTITSKGGNDLFTVYPDGNGTVAILDFNYEKDFINYLHNNTCGNCTCVEIID